MITLPGGFSPRSLVNEVVDTVNPFDGDTDHNIFSQRGNQRNGLKYESGAPTIPSSQVAGAYDGALYYDANNNQGQQFVNGQWQNVTQSTQGGQVQGVNTGEYNAAAQAAATRARNSNTITTAQGRIGASGDTAFNELYNSFNTGARSLVDTIRTGQLGIDRGRQNVELNKLNAVSGLNEQIRQGIQSGQIQLAAGNASDSSGREQLARAYAKIGAAQASDIYNEAALGNTDLDYDQDALDLQAAEGLRQLDVFKEEEKNRIGFEVENELLALEEQAADLGLGGQIQVQAMKQQIIDRGIQRLLEIDSFLQEGLGQIAPQSQGQIQAEAQRLRSVGRPNEAINFGNLTQSGPANTGFDLRLLGANRSEER